MAIHPNPDRDQKYMSERFGTICLITDPLANKYLQEAERRRKEKLKESKMIVDAWTI